MANKSIFCNVPWTNIHVYWDGSYGMCCSEKEKPYDEADTHKYNLSVLPMHEWYNSLPARAFRQKILSDTPIAGCSSCYSEEAVGHESRRIKENFKSVIFTEKAFERSYLQSPWLDKFEHSRLGNSLNDHVPIDWHIDFGNECNLACKMCYEEASSLIASTLRRHGLTDVQPKVTWTKNKKAWANFLAAVDAMPINRLHVMGGEPVMMRKYHEFIDYLVDKKRFEISLSFVSNGTIIDQSLIDKLKLFRNVDIEISIETMDKSNDYIRQGSTIEKMRANLQNIIAQQDDKLQIVMRTVPQLLSISRYVEVVRYAWENKIVIESIPLTQPTFMRIDVLPWNFRQQYVADLELLRDEIASEITFNSVLNGRSKGTLPMKLSGQCDAMIEMLQAPTNRNAEELRRELVKHCQFWDKEYDLKIDDYLPELASMFKEWGYGL